MLPENSKLLIREVRLPYLHMDNTPYEPLSAHELGGIAMSDTSLGLSSQVWNLSFKDKVFTLKNESGHSEQLRVLSGDLNVDKIAFSFDQNMKLAWGFSYNNPISNKYTTEFYWYNARINDYELLTLQNSRDICINLDDKRPESNMVNDIILSYINEEDWLCVRYQRDRYLRELKIVELPKFSIITRLGMTADYRFQFEIETLHKQKYKDDHFLLKDEEWKI